MPFSMFGTLDVIMITRLYVMHHQSRKILAFLAVTSGCHFRPWSSRRNDE
jgi:hypothetical protein